MPRTNLPPPKQPYPPKPNNYPENVAWGAEVDALIPRMAETIAERFNPLRIVLFGSRARGDQKPNSDVDLLVVVPKMRNSERRWLQAAIGTAVGEVGPTVEKHILVTSQKGLDDILHSERRWCAHYHAAQEGVTLYERSPG